MTVVVHFTTRILSLRGFRQITYPSTTIVEVHCFTPRSGDGRRVLPLAFQLDRDLFADHYAWEVVEWVTNTHIHSTSRTSRCPMMGS